MHVCCVALDKGHHCFFKSRTAHAKGKLHAIDDVPVRVEQGAAGKCRNARTGWRVVKRSNGWGFIAG
jgi:hypothetical protein